MMRVKYPFFVIVACFVTVELGDVLPVVPTTAEITSQPTSSFPTDPPTTPAPSSTTMSPEESCRRANNSCEECVKITKCYYCMKTDRCEYYPYNHIFPKSKECEMGDVRWAVCWLNFKAMIISLSVIGGVIIISLIVCCCCCCGRKKKSNVIKENAKREREREERRIKNLERQKEREAKHDEIRKKYGLIKDDQPYQRFDA